MKALFILNDPPYGTERAYNALRLAQALLKKESPIEITIFLMVDSVIAQKANQKTPEGYSTSSGCLNACWPGVLWFFSAGPVWMLAVSMMPPSCSAHVAVRWTNSSRLLRRLRANFLRAGKGGIRVEIQELHGAWGVSHAVSGSKIARV
jgi:hypothetical protein